MLTTTVALNVVVLFLSLIVLAPVAKTLVKFAIMANTVGVNYTWSAMVTSRIYEVKHQGLMHMAEVTCFESFNSQIADEVRRDMVWRKAERFVDLAGSENKDIGASQYHRGHQVKPDTLSDISGAKSKH